MDATKVASSLASDVVLSSPAHDGCARADIEAPAEPRDAGREEKLKKIRSAGSAVPKTAYLVTGMLLAACAGAVNAIAYLDIGVFVSHVTGTTAKIGIHLEGAPVAGFDNPALRQAKWLLCSFIAGAFISGILVSRNEIHLGKSLYGVALLLNSTLLITAMLTPDILESGLHHEFAGYLCAAACGLQNGMCTMHFGAVVRTTHLTGLATDMGIVLGRVAHIFISVLCAKRRLNSFERAELKVDVLKLRVFVVLLVGFVAGTISGANLQERFGLYALVVPASVTGIGGLAYTLFRTFLPKMSENAEKVRLQEDIAEVEEAFDRTLAAIHQIDDCKTSVEDLDYHVHHALDVFHEMESTVNELCYTSPLSPKFSLRSPSSQHSI